MAVKRSHSVITRFDLCFTSCMGQNRQLSAKLKLKLEDLRDFEGGEASDSTSFLFKSLCILVGLQYTCLHLVWTFCLTLTLIQSFLSALAFSIPLSLLIERLINAFAFVIYGLCAEHTIRREACGKCMKLMAAWARPKLWPVFSHSQIKCLKQMGVHAVTDA